MNTSTSPDSVLIKTCQLWHEAEDTLEACAGRLERAEAAGDAVATADLQAGVADAYAAVRKLLDMIIASRPGTLDGLRAKALVVERTCEEMGAPEGWEQPEAAAFSLAGDILALGV